MTTFAIIGAGIAGVSACEALRDQGFDGEILLFNEEPELPYDRPPLSKAYAAGALAEKDIWLRPETWYEERRITHLQGAAVTSIDPAAHTIHTATGAHHYDKLLIATGAKARCPKNLDPNHPNVILLRTAADARRLRARLTPGANIILAGGGVIGMECAATAIKAGCAVTVLEGFERIMARFLAPAVAEAISARHRAEGVVIRTHFSIASIAATGTGVTVTSASGEILSGDLVIVGMGAAPDIALAEAAGLYILAGGIAVDEVGRSSDPDIYAAGDCASFRDSKGQHIRLENWTHAVRHAQTAARSMLGEDIHYNAVPWVWSDQYNLNIQVLGEATGAKSILRGAPESQKFTAIHLSEDGVIVGATSVNHGRDKRVLEKLIAAHATVPPEKLADESIPLKSLIPAEAPADA